MLLSYIDFEKYKFRLEANLKREFSSSEEFEEYVKKYLGTKNTRIFVANIARAIILQNGISFDLDRYTDKEIITLINVSQNKEKLLEHKEQENLKPYLEMINSNKLELIRNLERVFFNSSIEKLVFQEKSEEVVGEEVQTEKESDDLENIKSLYTNLSDREKNEFRIWLIKQFQDMHKRGIKS